MQFTIHGGKPLRGKLAVNGSKNSALKLLSAALLAHGPVTLTHIPDVTDVRQMISLIGDLGITVRFHDHTCHIEHGQPAKSRLDFELAKRLRASIMLAAPLLARTGSAAFPHPGGCVIGERPIDVFLDGYAAFGATVIHTQKEYTVTADEFHPARFVFSVISVQGTESMMMLAASIKGTSTLINAACEPDIVTLANFLIACGARITGAGTPTITIEGGTWRDEPIAFTNIPDRIEAGSFLILGLAARASLEITDCDPTHLEIPLAYLRKMGARFDISDRAVRIHSSEPLTAINIKTHEYPGFPTDLQSPMVVLMTQAEGQSIVHETIFEGRMAWTEELTRMGANILNLDNFRVAVTGPTVLRGRTAESLDIRAGMAYVIAGLIARGTSIVSDIEKIDRGYECIEKRLSAIGADITRN